MKNDSHYGDAQKCFLYNENGEQGSYYGKNCDAAANLFLISLIAALLVLIYAGTLLYMKWHPNRNITLVMAILQFTMVVLTLAGSCLIHVGLNTTAKNQTRDLSNYLTWYGTEYLKGNLTLIPVMMNSAWASMIIWIFSTGIEAVEYFMHERLGNNMSKV